MERLNHGCSVVTKGFCYLETLGLLFRLVDLGHGIIDARFDADGFFVGIGLFRRLDKHQGRIKSGIISSSGRGIRSLHVLDLIAFLIGVGVGVHSSGICTDIK